MDGTGFLKTVRVGGFDKKDVLAYVDDLNTKIYTLEAELEEKKTLLESASSGGTVDTSKYDELLAADKAKIAELQTDNNSLRNQMKILEDDMASVNKEMESLKGQNTALEEELQDAKNKIATGGTSDSAMDLSNVFIEAQKTANSIVAQAKESARKMDEDAKKLANQVVDDANGKASTIVKSAEDKANKIVAEAEDKTAELRVAVNSIKSTVTSEIIEIGSNVSRLTEVLQIFSTESLSRLVEAKSLIEKSQDALQKGSIPPIAHASKPAAAAPRPAPKPAPAPAPAPAKPAQQAPPASGAPAAQAAPPPPAPKPAAPPAPAPAPARPVNKFGFDMSELESLTKAAEEAESAQPYDGNVDPSRIKLSKM